MSKRAASVASGATWLLVAGFAVGLLAAHWAAGSGEAACAPGPAGLPCLELTQALAVRVGLFTGVMTIIVLLSSAGMLRMQALDERRRATIAREAREGSFPFE